MPDEMHRSGGVQSCGIGGTARATDRDRREQVAPGSLGVRRGESGFVQDELTGDALRRKERKKKKKRRKQNQAQKEAKNK